MDDYVQRITRTLDTMDPTIPPSYGGPSRAAALPVYSRRASSVSASQRPVLTEHRYHLSSRRSKPPWATLKVFSRSPTPAQLPTFFEGDKITGSLALNLEQTETITCVSVVVCCFSFFSRCETCSTSCLTFQKSTLINPDTIARSTAMAAHDRRPSVMRQSRHFRVIMYRVAFLANSCTAWLSLLVPFVIGERADYSRTG